VAIHYALARARIEIPYPIQVEYSRDRPEPDPGTEQAGRERVLASVDLFATLSEEQRAELAAATTTHTFGDGEAIVRQGEPGDSMYVLCSGRVAVVLEPGHHEVAVIEQGGYFGEMSLLTGEPRTATVVARGEAVVLELDAALFTRLGIESPLALEQIGLAAVARREQLDRARNVVRGAERADAPATFLARMKRFLRLQ
jgi:CRP-like cAMP-binding protein